MARLGEHTEQQIMSRPGHVFVEENKDIAFVFNQGKELYLDVLKRSSISNLHYHTQRHTLTSCLYDKMIARQWSLSGDSKILYVSSSLIRDHGENSTPYIYVLSKCSSSENPDGWKLLTKIYSPENACLFGEFILSYGNDGSVLVSFRKDKQSQPEFRIYKLNRDIRWEYEGKVPLPVDATDVNYVNKDIIATPGVIQLYIKNHLFVPANEGNWRYVGWL